MLPYQHWDEIVKEFTCEAHKSTELPSTDIATYFRSRYDLWLDFRSSDDQRLHGSGRRVENASEGITLQLDKTAQPAAPPPHLLCLPSDGCSTKHRRWAVNIGNIPGPWPVSRTCSTCVTCRARRTRRLFAARPGAARHSLFLTSSSSPRMDTTVAPSNMFSHYALHGSVTKPIWIDRGFGAAHMPTAFSFLTPKSDSTTGCALSLTYAPTHPHYISSTLWPLRKPSQKKKDMLSELAFSGRHAKQSVWVLVQKYNAVCKDLREQTKWVALFHCKDRFSFVETLNENDVVPYELCALLRTRLAQRRHAKLVLKTDQPTAYVIT